VALSVVVISSSRCALVPAGAAGLRFSGGSSGRGRTSWSDGRGDGGDAGEGIDEIVGPGPGGRDAEMSASGAVGQSGWDVQQAVAQCFGFSCGQWPAQRK
jgi:hypothetical protein